ncbi:MAG: hypothetical protein AAGK37_23160 [Pseudomonadota bacterium]
MDHLKRPGVWAYAFLFGTYRGPAVDYLMAIAVVYAAMVVLVVHNLAAGA